MDREGRALVGPYKRQNRLTFPHLLDSKNDVTADYGVSHVPMTFIVNKRGQVVARVVGPRPWASPEFQRLFEEMISEE
jgi:peroxiredoxin